MRTSSFRTLLGDETTAVLDRQVLVVLSTRVRPAKGREFELPLVSACATPRTSPACTYAIILVVVSPDPTSSATSHQFLHEGCEGVIMRVAVMSDIHGFDQ